MPAPQFVSRDYAGASQPAQLQAEMGAGDLSFAITPTTGWTNSSGDPLGTGGPFTLAVDRFTPSEEKILCSAINLSTGVVTVYVDGGDGWNGRGYDDSTPQAHVPGGSTEGVQTLWSAVEAAEANDAVTNVLGAEAVGAFGVPIGALVPWAGPRTTVPSNFKLCDGSAISRSTFAALLAASTVTTTGNVSSTSVTISGIPSAAVAEMGIGMKIEGLGISPGATIASIPTTTAITISSPAVGTHSETALTAYLWGNGDGTTTFNLPDARGKTSVGANGTGTNASPTYAAGETGGEQLHALVTGEGDPHTHTDGGHYHNHAHTTSVGNESANHDHTAGGGVGATGIGIRYGGGTEGTTAGSIATRMTFTAATDGESADHSHGVTLGDDATIGTAAIASAGGGSGHNNMQPFFVTNWIVRSN